MHFHMNFYPNVYNKPCNGKLHAKLSQNVVKPDHTCKKPGRQNDPHLMDCNKALVLTKRNFEISGTFVMH